MVLGGTHKNKKKYRGRERKRERWREIKKAFSMTIKMICQSIEEAGLKEESWWIGLQIELEWAKRHEGDGEEEKEKTFRKFDLRILQVQIRELLVKVVRKGEKTKTKMIN